MPNVMAALPNVGGAKFGWRLLLECRALTLPRRETRWNLLRCPKLANRSQPLVGRSSAYCEDMWGKTLLFNKLFAIVNACLSCENIAKQSCAMVPRWRILAIFWVLYFQRATCSTFQTCILNSHYGHIMCRSMVHIQSATAEIRQGKKEERKS